MFLIFRYRIKEITNHPFFQEDSGVKVNLVDAESGIDIDYTKPGDTVKLLLQLEDPKKRKDKHKENEGIQFDFNLGTDQPEKVTQELVRSHFIFKTFICMESIIIHDIVHFTAVAGRCLHCNVHLGKTGNFYSFYFPYYSS